VGCPRSKVYYVTTIFLRRNEHMLKTVRVTFAFIALALSIYSFITDNRGILLYMFSALGLVSFTMSIEELREQKKEVEHSIY